jgi:ATP-binding cassette subfamily F protein uup
LKELEGLLASLPEDIARHDATLSDPDLYARDRKAFDKATANADRARTLLAAAEEEWLELEAKREALASA